MFFGTFVFVAGCKSDADKARDKADQIRSLRATIVAVDSARHANRVPDKFADRTIEDARAQLRKLESQP